MAFRRWLSLNGELLIALVMTAIAVGLLMRTLGNITARLDEQDAVIEQLCTEPVNEIHCTEAKR